jgi:hypothetical protein
MSPPDVIPAYPQVEQFLLLQEPHELPLPLGLPMVAKDEYNFSTLLFPQCGHEILVSALKMSFSNSLLQRRHLYSYIGIHYDQGEFIFLVLLPSLQETV